MRRDRIPCERYDEPQRLYAKICGSTFTQNVRKHDEQQNAFAERLLGRGDIRDCERVKRFVAVAHRREKIRRKNERLQRIQ